MPVTKEEFHADSALYERHALPDVVGELGVLDLKEVEAIVGLDLLCLGLEKDVTEPYVPKMVLEDSDEVALVVLIWRSGFDAFELDKIATVDAVLLVDGEGLEFVDLIEVHVA